VKLFVGNEEVAITTNTELLLASALKAVTLKFGSAGWLKDVFKEFELEKFSLIDAARSTGDLQLGTDSNNGNNVVRIKV
jgi:hypothetical protein